MIRTDAVKCSKQYAGGLVTRFCDRPKRHRGPHSGNLPYCVDQRHENPCPDPQTCSACMEECDTHYWYEADGQPWGEVGLTLNGA